MHSTMVCSLRPRFIITRTLRRLKMKSSATRPTSKCALNPPCRTPGSPIAHKPPPATTTFKSRTSAKTRPVTAQLVSDQYWPRAINHLVGHLTHVAQCRDTEWQQERGKSTRLGKWSGVGHRTKVDYTVSPDVQQEITCDYNAQFGARI